MNLACTAIEPISVHSRESGNPKTENAAKELGPRVRGNDNGESLHVLFREDERRLAQCRCKSEFIAYRLPIRSVSYFIRAFTGSFTFSNFSISTFRS